MQSRIDQQRKKSGTKTSSFGTPGRINHDSSRFYNSRLYAGLTSQDDTHSRYVENNIAPQNINKIFCKSSEHMDELPDCSVHLMVTSPPYNVGKDYDENLSLEQYRELLRHVFKETYRVLVPGGRACINIANLGRKPYIPLHSSIIQDMQNMGFLMRGEIIWNKDSSASPSTAWGTWLKANNPVLRDIHEYILVFCKDTFTRRNPYKRKSTISKKEFLSLTKSVWLFAAERAKKVGHPAPFPIELPYRLIQLYTFEGEVVLDPFVGSGSACIAASKTNRRYIGYDINEEYCRLAEHRIAEYLQQQIKLLPDSIFVADHRSKQSIEQLNDKTASKPLCLLRNIGPKLEGQLHQIGIHTIDNFMKSEPTDLYRKLETTFDHRVDRNTFYRLAGARLDIPWYECKDSPRVKKPR